MWKNLIERIWPLPAPEKRHLLPFFFVPQYIKSAIRPDRSGDYVCWQAGAVTQMTAFGFLFILLVDAAGQFGWFLDLDAVAEQKVYFVVAWWNVVGKVAVFLGGAFYLRLRLSTNLRAEQVPMPFKKETLRRWTRREWIQGPPFFLVIVILTLSWSDGPARGFMEMWNLQDNLIAVVIEQALFAYLIPFFVLFGVCFALIFEKAIRFFPEAKRDLENW